MNVAVVDDEEYYANDISRRIYSVSEDLFAVDVFSEGIAFFYAFEKKEYDLVYLDIELKDINGIDLAYKMKAIKDDVMIIFVTSHLDYMNDGYIVDAFQYFLKPIDQNLFKSELNRALKTYQNMNHKVKLKTRNGTYFIYTNDIICIETYYKNYKLQTTNNTYYGSKRQLYDMRQRLCEHDFMQTHRSYTVNFNHIVKVKCYDIYLSNGKIVPLARSRVKKFKLLFNERIKT